MKRTAITRKGKPYKPVAVEVWADAPGFGGHYQVSSLGSVRVKDRIVKKRHRSGGIATQFYPGRPLAPHQNPSGYLMVHLGWDGHKKGMLVHHMVLLAFHGPRPTDHVGCHFNGVKTDNRPGNLRWDTHTGNMADRQRMGRYACGESHPMAKIPDALAEEILLSPLSAPECARRFGISKSQAYRIKNGQRKCAA